VAEPGAAPSTRAPEPRPTATGPGRVLVAVYAVFALAATSRAAVQLARNYAEAPLAYLLSAFSAVVYLVATIALARRGARARRVAVVACSVELVGVLVVGTASIVAPEDFPRATVWSGYGSGYGFVPLVLPVVGLWWLRRTSRRTQGN
jgi:cytochrome bd-type quinol oxidase subunit 2